LTNQSFKKRIGKIRQKLGADLFKFAHGREPRRPQQMRGHMPWEAFTGVKFNVHLCHEYLSKREEKTR